MRRTAGGGGGHLFILFFSRRLIEFGTLWFYNRRYRHLKIRYLPDVHEYLRYTLPIPGEFFFLQTNESLVVRGHGLY